MKEARMFAEAAAVLRDYLDDPEEAIASLVEGSRWDEADRLIVKEDRADLYGEIHVEAVQGRVGIWSRASFVSNLPLTFLKSCQILHASIECIFPK